MSRMSFSGADLQLVRVALDGYISDLHMQIASCPDVVHYAEDIKELEAAQAQASRLAALIDKRHPDLIPPTPTT